MSTKKVTIQVTGSGILQDDVIMLGEGVLKALRIPSGRPLQLQFGSFRREVTVIPVPRYDGLRINQTVASQTGLVPRSVLSVSYRSASRTLRLGPFISVLVSQDYPDQPDRPFGSITMFCHELVNACRKQGAYVSFFTPEDIGTIKGQMRGWVYDDGWKKTVLPVADVVNNRLTSRKLENKPSVQHFMKEVKSLYGTQTFNEKFLDKNEVFDALKSITTLKRVMPDSHLLKTSSMLKTMCNRYPVVFLKPVRGSLGKGIIRVSRQNDGSFLTLATSVGGTRKQTYTSLDKLYASLSGKMKTTRYQIQQGLTLIDNSGRPVDFRALVQKNKVGKWSVTSIVARIAGGNHYVSNLARGGSLSTVKEAVAKTALSSAAKASAYAGLHTAALDIAKGIEQAIPAHFGELGIDLALDTSGRVWLLEVNSKPSKNDNTPLSESKIRPSVKAMLEYSSYLAGF
ncbi:YheC/YheD family endospore coat-associated protein [Paenibacillus xylanexedens]|uniref:YheC/YheD family endospore coat-associated protein n=1 Tax=Paenibacillus xylanexedens TaxID=528191 RepID=UPI0011A9DD10|nr:YheC/YheD family protein [Paenibacillus xylanexedens]